MGVFFHVFYFALGIIKSTEQNFEKAQRQSLHSSLFYLLMCFRTILIDYNELKIFRNRLSPFPIFLPNKKLRLDENLVITVYKRHQHASKISARSVYQKS